MFFSVLEKEFIVLEIYSSKRLGVRTEIQPAAPAVIQNCNIRQVPICILLRKNGDTHNEVSLVGYA